MKKLFIGVIALSAITFAACNNNESKSEKDMSEMKNDSTKPASTTDDKDVKEVSPTFTSVDATTAGYIKSVVDHYLHVKNALANDNESEAANGAKMISGTLAKVDKSFFTPEQKKIYDENEVGLKQHAELISKSKIDQQREHFVMMSENVYSLVKAFGGGRTLYHDHCPMANNNKGALWISELADIKNPYMGSKMQTCGTVEEKIN
jgi:glutamyl/glutaminyl-tRNA synthetase